MNDTSNNYLEDGAEWGRVQDAISPNGEDGKKAKCDVGQCNQLVANNAMPTGWGAYRRIVNYVKRG